MTNLNSVIRYKTQVCFVAEIDWRSSARSSLQAPPVLHKLARHLFPTNYRPFHLMSAASQSRGFSFRLLQSQCRCALNSAGDVHQGSPAHWFDMPTDDLLDNYICRYEIHAAAALPSNQTSQIRGHICLFETELRFRDVTCDLAALAQPEYTARLSACRVIKHRESALSA